MHVALFALDELGGCGSAPDAVAALERTVSDLSSAGVARSWHRAAHALVALATAQPDARRRGAAAVHRLAHLAAADVRGAGGGGAQGARHARTARARRGRQRRGSGGRRACASWPATTPTRFTWRSSRAPAIRSLRAAALALEGTPHPDIAAPALQAAWQRLVAEGHDNSHDARDAIAKTLTALGDPPKKFTPRPPQNDLNAEDLRRLAAPRARVTIRGVGTFELALFTSQAPAAVLRFAHLAEAGYYNGLTFHRVVANFVIQGGSPGASEYIGDASFMRDEVGPWPHVRGAVGISTRGRDTGDAQIFVDLVDNPRLDHEYTVFAQVLNGIEVVDQVLEGDVIERIEIVVGP